MNKIVLVILSIFVVSTAALAQAEKKTRPRIVREKASAQNKYPTIKNDPGVGTPAKKAPVLIDSSKGVPRSIPTPPPLVVEPINDENDVIEIETNLVTLPVTVMDRQGRFVSGLTERDFRVYEDGVEQKVGFFSSVETPFTVVLLIDTSPSTKYKIEEIRSAAISFVNQLRTDDKVMVVSFDQHYKVLTYPTNDRSRLAYAIRRADFGSGTSIYDAVNRTIDNELRQLSGRKAVVMFTDGVDTTSKRANYESSVRKAEEAEALIYPIRYDTSGQYSRGRSNRGRIPRRRSGGGILSDILVGIITSAGGGRISGGVGSGQTAGEYAKGKSYLEELARLSGGRIFEADTTYNLDAAFRSIAEELRRQYSLGYYPEETGVYGDRKRIRVRVRRTNLVVRTKRSYIVGK
jgi:VWFA-related protein